ncbi:hypothetical protein ABQF34_09605 [Mycolicibacterium boenickei]
MSAIYTPAVLGRRACALLAATSALLHVLMLGHAGNAVVGGLLAVMIIGCLYCARDLWSRGTSGVWCAVALMNLAMIALHTPMPVHHHGLAASPQQSPLIVTATLLALLEVIVAAAVLTFRTRHRSVVSPSTG